MKAWGWHRSVAPVVIGASVWLLMPAQSFARAVVRFVHGVPGVGTANVSVDDGSGRRTVGSIAFAQSTRWHSVRSGRFTWTLSGAGKSLASGTATVGSGAYDLVVLQHAGAVKAYVYRARGGRPNTSLVRVIHGAPEFGSPALTVDGKVAVKRLAYRQDTPYVALPAGPHRLGADRPGTRTPLMASTPVTLAAGQSYSAVVLGTRGQRVRVVSLVDRGGPLVRRRQPATHATPAPSQGSGVTVRTGDSLWSIARRLAGPGASDTAVQRRLVAIWDANERRIGTGDPNLIFPGTRLRV